MHAASMKSVRLRRVLRLLSDGQAHTTRDIVRRARVMAVSACVAELRTHGAEITCIQLPAPDEKLGRCWYYTMTKAPTE